jgi:hypothetical protein
MQLNEEGVKELFGAYGGVVSVTIVKDAGGRSKGYGFVEVRTRLELFLLSSQPYRRLSSTRLAMRCLVMWLWT